MEKEGYVQLERRTVAFSVSVIRLLRDLPRLPGTEDIKNRMVRSATTSGAEYREAVRSGDLFRHVRRLEAAVNGLSECAYWINLLHELNPRFRPIETLLAEACNLSNIMERIYREAAIRLVRYERFCCRRRN